MPPKIAKLAGLGAFGACAGLLALFAFIAFIARPGRLGGIDNTNAIVAWIALGGLFAALIIAHIAIGKQLLKLARGADVRHPL
ncbi:MAG TPA: hypothetical protein VEB19_08925 [Gemmatimonadaceae bacterium]|nr:hypothetical protein [Gemmatimonadaceae bacterium]